MNFADLKVTDCPKNEKKNQIINYILQSSPHILQRTTCSVGEEVGQHQDDSQTVLASLFHNVIDAPHDALVQRQNALHNVVALNSRESGK